MAVTDENIYFKMLRERRLMRQQIASLERQIRETNERLNCYHTNQSTIPPIQISAPVREWMFEYGLPREVFYCYEHKQWVEELDNSFSYFCDNRWHKCRE